MYLREECRHVVRMQQELESRDKRYSELQQQLGEYIYCGKELDLLYEEYGIRLRFRKKEIDREVSVTVSLNISGDDYSLPENSELVSAVYRIYVSGELPSPVTVEIQHCCRLRDSNEASALSFVRSETERGPPYQFEVIGGSQFTPNDFYGKIDSTHFSDIAIVRFFKRLLKISYVAIVYRKQILPTKYVCHIVVIKNLVGHITVSNNQILNHGI